MPLIVPVLRLAYTFLNVFETFKTLRPPLPSARNNGRPSVRALSQRKRAMKACMTIWLVWACFAMYERTLDSIISLFIPFYNEFKSLVILFFLLTRARGSEPIYLHILRPFIKPYASTIDTVLEVTSSFCDLIFLVVTMPYHFVVDAYRQWRYPPPSAQSTPEPLRESSVSRSISASDGSRERAREAPVATRQRIQRTTQIPRRMTEQEAARANIGRSQEPRRSRRDPRPVEPDVKPTISRRQPSAVPELTSRRRSSTREASQSLEPPPAYEIWYPPPSAYDAETNPMSGLPTPPGEKLAETTSTEPEDDWRQYPAFPAAYPPTPLPTTARTMPTHGAPLAPPPFSEIVEKPEDTSQLSAIVEDATPRKPALEEDFQRSLQSSRELLDPSSDAGSSDNEDSMEGLESVYHGSVAVAADDESMDEDEDDEDEFNVTLATPFPVKTMHIPTEKKKSFASSSESLLSRSTMLSTTDNGSDMRTRTNSQASTSQTSDDSSVAGRKRRLPVDEAVDSKSRGELKLRSRASRPVSVKLPIKSQRKSEQRVRRNSRGTYKCDISYLSDSEVEEEEEDHDVSPSSDAKRRKLRAPSEDRVARPTTKREESERTVRGVSRASQDSKAGTAARAPARKPMPVGMGVRDVSSMQRKPSSASGSSSDASSRRYAIPATERRVQDLWR